MADAIRISTVTASIAALTITVTNASGTSVTLSIKDTSAIPEAVNQQDCPVLFPKPDGFVTDLRVERDSFGADAALKTVYYKLNYLFFYAPALQGAGIFEKYDEMVTAAAAVLLHLSTNTALSGTTDILPDGVPGFGAMVDMTGTKFHGCEISLNIKQFMEA